MLLAEERKGDTSVKAFHSPSSWLKEKGTIKW